MPHNNNHGRRKHRNKTGKRQEFDREHVLVLGSNLKLRWEWRPVNG